MHHLVYMHAVFNYKAVGSGEAGEALASPDVRPNSDISALTFFSFSSHKYVTVATITYSANT